jgi:putative SOS response-associated peptidase YedK
MIGYELRVSNAELDRALGVMSLGLLWSNQGPIEPTINAPVIVHDQPNLFEPRPGRLELRRYGLVPEEYCSSNDADRFKHWHIRAERVWYQRNHCELLHQRCLIPMTGFVMEREVNGLRVRRVARPNDGRIVLAAGIFSDWQKPGKHLIRTFGILTVAGWGDTEALNSKTRIPALIDPTRWLKWLDPGVPAERAWDFLETPDSLDFYFEQPWIPPVIRIGHAELVGQ